MELKQVVSNYKFGILYAKEGQTKENEMFANGTHTSDLFFVFVSLHKQHQDVEGGSQCGMLRLYYELLIGPVCCP